MEIFRDYDLSLHNTFRMKVRCACFVEYDSPDELLSPELETLPKPFKHIGGGANLLFTGDFPGTILHSRINHIKYVDMGLDEVPVIVGAGVVWDEFVEQTCRHGLWGAENLSLIPGETGAAAVQNIGAYGVEIKDIISGVSCFDNVERKRCKFTAAECGYGYRDSMFKQSGGRYTVLSVLIRLSRKPRPRLEYKGLEGIDASGPMAVRNAVVALRQSKLPDPAETGSVGSYFKNPVVTADVLARVSDAAGGANVPHYILPGGFVKIPAAWLIDSCGLKGSSEGGAAVYERQAVIIINRSGDATPSDILRLEKRITDTVFSRYGIALDREVEYV